jgi:hypothetical protein
MKAGCLREGRVVSLLSMRLPTLLVDPLHLLALIKAQFECISRLHGKQMTHLSMNQLYPRIYLLSIVPRPVWFIALSK